MNLFTKAGLAFSRGLKVVVLVQIEDLLFANDDIITGLRSVDRKRCSRYIAQKFVRTMLPLSGYLKFNSLTEEDRRLLLTISLTWCASKDRQAFR